ncbi:MAG: CRISPR-associated endonuclease Cas1 [Armatimonadetes bacterium]|nr:CRISPR-associated endonuclease Cas1 [Armatimonadota bacterium]
MVGQTLYVAEPGAEIRRAGTRLRIDRDGQCLTRVSPQTISQVIIFGDVFMSPNAVDLLLRARVPVSLLTSGGRLRGRIVPPDVPSPSLRQAQYQCASDFDYALGFAQALVRTKITGGTQLLRRHARDETRADIEPHLSALRKARASIRRVDTVEALRGVEGRAGAAYFDAFRELLADPAEFIKRTRRPPRDPVNALLSFGYSILGVEVAGQIAAVGLDPQVGFLHVTRAGRPALALDLLEEFRAPVVDRVVLRCWNLRIVTSDDFISSENGVPILRPDARTRFLHEYESRMSKPFQHVRGFRTTYRRLVHGQARAVAHCLRYHEAYRGLPVRL